MECESCGKPIEPDEPLLVLIEGARLTVCRRCSRLGRIIRSPLAHAASSPHAPGSAGAYSRGPSLRAEFELVEDYGHKIRAARENMHLPLQVLAERIAQKESFLDRIEKQRTRPTEELARKLEKELHVKLMEEADAGQKVEISSKPLSAKGLTLGDILEIEKKKKK